MNKIEKFNYANFGSDKEEPVQAADFSAGLKKAVRVADQKKDNSYSLEPEATKPVEKTYSEKEFNDSRIKGYEEGYAKGFGAAKGEADDLNKQIEETIKSIDAKLASISDSAKDAVKKDEQEVARLVMIIAKKIAGDALEKNPLPEVERIINKAFEQLFDEPVVTIHISAKVAAGIKDRIDSMTAKKGFTGKVEILEKQDFAPSQCEVMWSGGGMSGDKDIIIKEIDDMCSKIL